LAYLELEVAVASIFHRFHVDLVHPEDQLDTLEWFNSSPGELWVKLTPRSHELKAMHN
jgi:hypothetical protein